MVQFISEPPKVFVVGVTMPIVQGFEDYLAYRGVTWNTPDPIEGDPQAIIEAAGRVCYQSWHNPAGKTRKEYLQGSIIEHGHGSTLEHMWVNCLIGDLPRSSQLETVRHGDGTGFSFESTRFTDKHLRFVVPPKIRREDNVVLYAWKGSVQSAVESYEHMIASMNPEDVEGTLKKKRAKEAARSLLPNAQGSDGMFSVNARAARHIINLRTDEHADLSIREFAYALYQALKPWAPAVFADAIESTDAQGIPTVTFKVPKV